MKLKTFILSLFMLLAFTSCKDECKDVNCNYGSCDDGTCICDDGYEGNDCATEIREKYIGNWTGDVNCNGELVDNTDLVVTKSAQNINSLVFFFDQEIYFNVSIDNDTFILGKTIDDEIEYSGEGSINSNNQMIINLTILDTEDPEESGVCIFNLTKQ